MKLTKAVIHTLVIFVVLSLVIQPISSTNAQVSDERKKAEDVSKKIQVELDKAKSTLKITKNAWKIAKNVTDDAKDAFKQNPTESNLFALNQAKQAEAKAYQNYKNVLVKVQAFKPDITPDVIEKAEKSTDDSTVDSKSDERKKAEGETIKITNKIQIQLDTAKSTLQSAALTLDNSKINKEIARQNFIQNPTEDNLSELNQAKQDEAFALFFYHKALNDVKFYKAKLVDFS